MRGALVRRQEPSSPGERWILGQHGTPENDLGAGRSSAAWPQSSHQDGFTGWVCTIPSAGRTLVGSVARPSPGSGPCSGRCQWGTGAQGQVVTGWRHRHQRISLTTRMDMTRGCCMMIILCQLPICRRLAHTRPPRPPAPTKATRCWGWRCCALPAPSPCCCGTTTTSTWSVPPTRASASAHSLSTVCSNRSTRRAGWGCRCSGRCRASSSSGSTRAPCNRAR